MKSNIFRLFTVLAVFAVGIVQAEAPLKVGVIIVQSGPLAAVGRGIVNAMVLADEEHDRENKVELIFEDDGLQPLKAVSAANKLITQDRVGALVTFTGGTSAAVAGVAETQRVPLITIAAGEQHTVGRKYVYRLFLARDAQVKSMWEEMERQGVEKVAIATTTQESLVQLRDHFVSLAGEAVVADEEAAPGDGDMVSLATRVNRKHPDSVVLYLLPPQLAAFSKAMRDQGFKGTFFGGIQIYNFPEIAASKGALLGTIFPAPNVRSESFYQAYEKRFKEPLASEQEVYGYDIVTMLAESVGKGALIDHLGSLQEIRGLAGIYPRRTNNYFEVSGNLKRVVSQDRIEHLKPNE